MVHKKKKDVCIYCGRPERKCVCEYDTHLLTKRV